MKISELKEGQSNVNVKGKVIRKEDTKLVETRFGKKRVCNFELEDDSGSITLVLWEDQIDEINVGDYVEITNGYVNKFRGKLQLNVGKFGKISKV